MILEVLNRFLTEVTGSYLAAQTRAPRIVLMSFHDESELRRSADAAGADGFIHKQELGTKVVPMIPSFMDE